MEREIKFKGRHINSIETVYGFYFIDSGREFIMEIIGPCWEIEPESAGQLWFSIGGFEIYEGMKFLHGNRTYTVFNNGTKFYADAGERTKQDRPITRGREWITHCFKHLYFIEYQKEHKS